MSFCIKKLFLCFRMTRTNITHALLGMVLYSFGGGAYAAGLPDLQKPITGMKTMRVTPVTPEKKPDAPLPESLPHKSEGKISDPSKKAAPARVELSVKEALVTADKLKAWDKMSLAASGVDQDELTLLLSELDKNRDVISPRGLILSAKALADAGRMEDAAIALFVGQMRHGFDIRRWPARPKPASVSVGVANAKKTEDQKLPDGSGVPVRSFPDPVQVLSDTVSPPILEWAVRDPKRFGALLEKAKAWDLSARYGYKPDLEDISPRPEKEWPDLLQQAREEYFLQMFSLQGALGKYIAPVPHRP